MVLYQSKASDECQSPRCTVVIAVRDDNDRLRSLLSCLSAQSIALDDFEIIVCDDGGTQLASDVMSQLGHHSSIRFLRQDRRGVAAARNLGIIHARSPFVIFLDCEVHPDQQLLGHLVLALENNLSLSGGTAVIINSGESDSPVRIAKPVVASELGVAAVAYRADAIRAVGGFNEAFEDAKYQLVEIDQRLSERGQIRAVSNAFATAKSSCRTIASSWASKSEWRYKALLSAQTSCPEHKQAFPRLNTVLIAVLFGPIRQVFNSLRSRWNDPYGFFRDLFLALIDWCGAVYVAPRVLLDATPERLAYVEPAKHPIQPVAVSKAS